jgi:two-component system sensor histidine kinase HydH
MVEDELIGFIVLGEKLSGQMYSQDDLAVFSVLADNLGIAVENALSFEEIRNIREQLIQSEKLAAVGKFASSLTHEIRNPLTAIKTFTEYLPDKKNDTEFLNKFSKIVSVEVGRIDSLVHQLLDFAKPIPLKLQEVDIHELLDDTLNLLSNEFIKHKIRIVRNFNSDSHRLNISGHLCVKVDPNRLKQVFLNLFFNAIEAMPLGGTLTVSTRLCSFDTKSVIISIKDTGSGISKDDLPHIFEPFYSKKEKGTGLGLAIVYNIIKEHKGDIKVESKVNQGTKFIIELALA